MAGLTNRGIPLSWVGPKYLHTNSTSHTSPFSAIAELIDNSYDPDVNAKQIWIDKSEIKDQDCIIFMDNGKGMDYDKLHKMLSFGFSDKLPVKDRVPVGLYGNGFKSSSMRLGKDAIVFSKKATTMCVGLLSQTYLEETGAQNVLVPIVMFTKTGETVSAAPEHSESLNDILKYSLLNTTEELLTEFSVIEGGSGTRIIIWNLRKTSSGELEMDFKKEPSDFQIRTDVRESSTETNKRQLEGHMLVPESEYSLRAYCRILYLKPKLQIILQGKKVKTQYVKRTLAVVLKDEYKPDCTPPLEKPVPITFGYNARNKQNYGLMMYYKNRLIKAYERVPCQRKAKIIGAGIIGVMECNYLTPTHNKQNFENTEIYRKTMINVGRKLEEYWKEVHHRYKTNTNYNKPLEKIEMQPDQNWINCEKCLKWRKLPDGINSKQLPDKWFCYMNRDPKFRSCEAEEELEDSEDEQLKYQKTYKQNERNQKIQDEKSKHTEQQNPCNLMLSPKITNTPAITSSSHTGSSPSDNNSVDNKDTQDTSTPKSKSNQRIQQEKSKNTEQSPCNLMPSLQMTKTSAITSSAHTGSSPSNNNSVDTKDTQNTSTSEGHKRRQKQSAKAPVKKKAKGNIPDSSSKSTTPAEGSSSTTNQIIHTNSKDYLSEDLLQTANETIEKLQDKVASVKMEKYVLLSFCESLKKDLEVFEREIEKAKTSVDTCTETYSLRLRELRQKVASLLANYINPLDP